MNTLFSTSTYVRYPNDATCVAYGISMVRRGPSRAATGATGATGAPGATGTGGVQPAIRNSNSQYGPAGGMGGGMGGTVGENVVGGAPDTDAGTDDFVDVYAKTEADHQSKTEAKAAF